MLNNALFLPTMALVLQHWQQSHIAIAPKTLIIRLPDDDTPVTRAEFLALRDALQAQQSTVQSKLVDQQIARSVINMQKAVLLGHFNQFNARLDAYYRNTRFYDSRPLAPSLTDGQEAFSGPMGDAMTLWEKINSGPAPAGVTLPLTVPDGTVLGLTQGAFASAISALQFAYNDERSKAQDVDLARSDRDILQNRAYAIMKAYREAVPGSAVANFPSLVETLPRLSPLPGHTPDAVNSSAIFVAPNLSKVVYDASTDPMLASYQLRGTVGDDYSDEDAVIIATNAPGAPREFVVPFGLNQPGAQVALKVYVILTTDNEAGSAAMFVERPVSLPLAA